MTKDELVATVAKYQWYHNIDLGQGVITPGHGFFHIWDFIREQMARIDFKGKSVIDIGCRDGMFALEAERMGASQLVAVDSDLSTGMVELVIPELNSSIKVVHDTIYKLAPWVELFDITMLFGLLYHLRYPFSGLRSAINLTKQGGLILIESGFFRSEPQDLPLMYCPFIEGNPYEPGSPSFFNSKGLVETMKSFGCVLEHEADLPDSDSNRGGNNNVRRGFMVFRRDGDTPDYLKRYWDGVHDGHSDSYKKEMEWRKENT